MRADLRLGKRSCFIQRMHAQQGNAKSTPDQMQDVPPQDRPTLRRLRAVLALGYGGLLVLLLGSGANALQTLRKLHDAEESARQRSVERRRVLTTVVLSATVYSNNVERILLSERPPEDDGITAEVLQRAKEAMSA